MTDILIPALGDLNSIVVQTNEYEKEKSLKELVVEPMYVNEENKKVNSLNSILRNDSKTYEKSIYATESDKKLTNSFYKMITKKRLSFLSKSIKLSLATRNFATIALPNYTMLECYKPINSKVKKETSDSSAVSSGSLIIRDKNDEMSLTNYLNSVEDPFIKVIPGRLCYMEGKDESIMVGLTAQSVCLVSKNGKIVENSQILYETITDIIVGAYGRWIIIKKICEESIVAFKDQWFQFEVLDSSSVQPFIRDLEICHRKRMCSLLGKRFKLSTKRYYSLGRFLDHFAPNVVSCSSLELQCMDRWLQTKNIVQDHVQILGCWLVFWENGSAVDEPQEKSSKLEGYLMVNTVLKEWVPAYFILKRGILCQFKDASDSLPEYIIELHKYIGCSRIKIDSRPHSFQLMSDDENNIQFAAPNDRVACQWLQEFFIALSAKDCFEKKRHLRSCQLIQTSSSIILMHQWNPCHSLKQNDSKCKKIEKKVSAKTKPVTFPTIDNTKTSKSKIISISALDSEGIPMSPTRIRCRIPQKLKSKIEIKETEALRSSVENPFVFSSCPATPKHFTLPSALQHDEKLHTEDYSFSLLSCCNVDQISEIFVSGKTCFVEFECSEAFELATDWALYFHSEEQLQSFLAITSSSKVKTTQTEVFNGNIWQFLKEGASTLME